MKTITLSRNSIHSSLRRYGLLLIPLLLTCFALMPMAQAVGPDTDGTIPGSNNGEGIGVLVSRTNGVWNTGTGFEALNHLTAGNQNTATGLRALFSDTNGGFNTATGVFSLFGNTSGFFNSATGAYSLAHNTDGSYNTANGYGALYFNTEGERNTANGFAALYRNGTGYSNTASGFFAMFANTTGAGNTAIGDYSLSENTQGELNTAIGNSALDINTTGNSNTAVGTLSLGYSHGDFNTALGAYAGNNVLTANNVICIGANVAGEDVSNTAWLGNVYGVSTQSGTTAPVIVSDTGQLGTVASSERFKKDIATMEKASEAILVLRPVTFHYKSDAKVTPQFGLIAEEVAKVNPALVLPDKEGKPYTVRYDAVNAMLLNEFLKEHRRVQELKSTVATKLATMADLKSTVAQQQQEIQALAATVKEQTAQIQRVSAQLEASKPAPQVVNNP
jgi:uncharacterized coiled-coil protein SlyX